jgi:cytidylate kinase
MKLFGKNNSVAIDGPAGSGKSTVSRLVAGRLGFMYLDTGAMYRALTLKVMNTGLDFEDTEKIVEVSASLDIEFIPDGGDGSSVRTILEGEDVSEDIREMHVSGNVKYVARIPEVRNNLVKLQRKMASRVNGAVMEGRDIGTVVLPSADYKFFVDADFEERVRRRHKELIEKGMAVTQPDVEEDLKQRDHSDRTRKVGPLRKAEDAVLIDTTDLSIDEVVNVIVGHIRGDKKNGKGI